MAANYGMAKCVGAGKLAVTGNWPLLADCTSLQLIGKPILF